MLRLTVVRHGATEWNQAGRFQGWADVPLSDTGRAQARAAAARLAGARWDAVVTSDLGRAIETASILAPGIAPRVDARFREYHFGAWDGLTWDECEARDPGLLHAWVDDPSSTPPPDGESAAAFQARVGEGLAALPEEGSVLLVVHAGVVHAALARWMEVEMRRTFALRLSPCGITRAEIFPGGGARILCVNEGGEPVVFPGDER